MKLVDPQTSSPGDAVTSWENQLVDLSHQLRQIDENLLRVSKQLVSARKAFQQLHSQSLGLTKKIRETQKRSIQSERELEDLMKIAEHDHEYIFRRLEKLEEKN